MQLQQQQQLQHQQQPQQQQSQPQPQLQSMVQNPNNPGMQSKFSAILSKVPPERLHLAEALIARLKTQQNMLQQQLLLQQQQQQYQQQLQYQQQQQQQHNQQQRQHSEEPVSTTKKGKKKGKDEDESGGGGGGKFDISREFDVTGGFIDIRDEEERMHQNPQQPPSWLRSSNLKSSNPTGMDRSRLQSLCNEDVLRRMVEEIASKTIQDQEPLHVSKNALDYISLSLQHRLQTFLESTIRIAKHRSGIHQHTFLLENQEPTPPPAEEEDEEDEESGEKKRKKKKQPPHPPTTTTPNKNKKYVDVKLGTDVKLILAALEKTEKVAETKEKGLLHPDGKGKTAAEHKGDIEAGVVGADDMDDGGGTGKKRKKKGEGKKDVMEFVKTKSTNSTALKAAGKKGMKSWMTGGGNAGGSASGDKGDGEGARKKRKTKGDDDGPLDYTDLSGVGTFDGGEGKKVILGRQMNAKEMCRVTLKDCVFVLEHEPQMRTSAFLAKWVTRVS
ncbi:UNVERIFIED_CONTAM: hypothetical protein HDU68_007190 [Siphonaria sp. JEL0065]|nr:hypothetical protein HDU68_007190 [Siphonaria sp. JEL0065]